jgi:hypothetical protein
LRVPCDKQLAEKIFCPFCTNCIAIASQPIAEVIGDATVPIDDGVGQIDIPLPKSVVTDGGFDRYTVEPWLVWLGPTSLALSTLPLPY